MIQENRTWNELLCYLHLHLHITTIHLLPPMMDKLVHESSTLCLFNQVLRALPPLSLIVSFNWVKQSPLILIKWNLHGPKPGMLMGKMMTSNLLLLSECLLRYEVYHCHVAAKNSSNASIHAYILFWMLQLLYFE